MNRSFSALLSISCFCVCSLALLGCNDRPPALPPSVTPPPAPGEQVAEEEHKHPDHGDRGGHMFTMSDDSRVEVAFVEEADMFTVWANDPDKVTKVEMVATIDGKDTAYPFKKTPTFTSAVYALTSPELATAVKMGEGVDIKLIIAHEDGEASTKYEHHEH